MLWPRILVIDVDGAFTIEAGPTLRLHLGCKRVILGRSERQEAGDAEYVHQLKRARGSGRRP